MSSAVDFIHDQARFIGAVETGDVKTATEIFAQYPDAIKWREDRDGQPDYSILHFAISSKSPEMVALVLQHKPELELGARNDMKPLMMAARTGAPEVVALLLEHGADASATDADGGTALAYLKNPMDEDGQKITRWLQEAMKDPAAGRAAKSQIGLKLAAEIADIMGQGIDVDNAPPVTSFRKHALKM